jgi:DNA-binding MarR family transcriptional regulator
MTASRRPVARIGYLIKWVERGLRAQLDAALAPHGLTTPEYTALTVLRQREGLSSAQLARRTLVTAQAMNQLVISLEQRRLVVRTADLANARIQRAGLTAKGRRLLDACDAATASIETRMLAGLTRSEVETMRNGLESCVASLGEPTELSGALAADVPWSASRALRGEVASQERKDR